jgi:hypothetical protein
MKLAAVAPAALFSVAPFRSIDLIKTFRAQLAPIHRATKVPVLLPSRLPLAGAQRFRVYATGGATRSGWNLELAAARNCGAADACFVASFEGRRHGILPRSANHRLKGGDRAYYHPISCGASCATASLSFVHEGVLYRWQVKDPPQNTRVVLARLANEAIEAGPR